MGRPREHDAATGERLLAAAAHLSARHGWDAVSVRRVAAEAGTSTRAVYSVFGSKRGLEQQLHEEMFERLHDLLRKAPTTDDPYADLIGQAASYRRWATERPERYAALMHFTGPHARARSHKGLALARGAGDELRDAIMRCAEAGLIDHSDVDEVTINFRALAHGLAELENHGVLQGGIRVWRSALTALLDGYIVRATSGTTDKRPRRSEPARDPVASTARRA